MNPNGIRLHLPAIPYTITRDEYSHDAYTGKVKRFSPMMRSRGFEVYHYGVETSESGATKDIQLMTKAEWAELRIQSVLFLEPTLTYEQAKEKHENPTTPPFYFSNWSTPLVIEFNKRLRSKLQEEYRGKKTDIVCLPLNKIHNSALTDMNYVLIESGIGYSNSFLDFRIFESYSWMSYTMGVQQKRPQNYWFVIPNYFDIQEFNLSLSPSPKRVGFLGRIGNEKGCLLFTEVAKHFPDVEFILCGAGDPNPFLKQPNIVYKPPIHGNERSDYLGSCVALLCPSKFIEPFCGTAVEAQLCGTPVICSDWGAMTETVEQGITGLRCHTLADYRHGIQMALDGKFDRSYIRERAVRHYDMYKVAHQYEYVFKSILDIYDLQKNGWYSPDQHIQCVLDKPQTLTVNPLPVIPSQPRIYLFLPYYGSLPNYFQLYLDSLAKNTDILTVFLITDIDTSSYKVPENLVKVSMSLEQVRQKARKFIYTTYSPTVEVKDLIKCAYKLVDFKIVYPILFDDLLSQYKVTEQDYVGWGDCDLIYGKLSNFIDFRNNYEILGGWHGHFTAIKNTESFKQNFKTIPNYLELITNNTKTFLTDEIAYREPLIKYLKDNNYKMFYANAYFCDIVPPCFYYKFRPDYAELAKNFFDVYNPTKNISYLHFDKSDGSLRVQYDGEPSMKEVLYCHLQKRPMTLSFTDYPSGFYIHETTFSLEKNTLQTSQTSTCFKKLQSLKEKFYVPDVIFDIGACKGLWTDECRKVYPSSKYFLFEALDYTQLDRFANDTAVKVYKNTILNDSNTDVEFYEMRNTGDSMFREKTHFFENPTIIKRKSVTLNTILENDQVLKGANQIFMKIDCQGAELPIVRGATDILSKTDFILLEIPFFGSYNEGVPTFSEHIQAMDSLGFIPYDITEEHTIKGFNVQVDLIFINKNHKFNTIVQEALLTKSYQITAPNPPDVQKKKHVTVLTYCSGYNYQTFFLFAATLYDTGFSGNLLFIIGKESDKEHVNRLTKKYKNISYYMDTVQNTRHCQQKRYYIYQRIFETLNLQTDYVLLCDSRDVFFQLNFESYPIDPTVDLFFFEEGLNIGDCKKYNMRWLKAIEQELQIEILPTVSNKKVLCSGTTFGRYKGIQTYVDRMCDLMTNKIHTDFNELVGFDQGIHNYLVYMEGFPELRVQCLPNENVLVNTLQYGYKFMLGATNQLVNKYRQPSYIVHQWDRLPNYMKDRLFLKYRSPPGVAGAPIVPT